jgi:hypothetical protein
MSDMVPRDLKKAAEHERDQAFEALNERDEEIEELQGRVKELEQALATEKEFRLMDAKRAHEFRQKAEQAQARTPLPSAPAQPAEAPGGSEERIAEWTQLAKLCGLMSEKPEWGNLERVMQLLAKDAVPAMADELRRLRAELAAREAFDQRIDLERNEGRLGPAPSPSPAPTPEPERQTGWLIEMPGPVWLRAIDRRFIWTPESHVALRFATRESAHAAMMAIREAHPVLFPMMYSPTVTEHVWISAPSPAPTTPDDVVTPPQDIAGLARLLSLGKKADSLDHLLLENAPSARAPEPVCRCGCPRSNHAMTQPAGLLMCATCDCALYRPAAPGSGKEGAP